MKKLDSSAKFKLHKNVITRFTKAHASPGLGERTTIFTSSMMDFGRKA